jgi:hypothetical protein
MTRKQRNELRYTADRIASNAGMALTLAWESAKGKTEAEAVDTISELLISAKADIGDLQNLIEEIRESQVVRS